MLIESQKVKSSAKKVKEGGPAAAGNQEHKYENYFSFSCSVRDVKPHAVSITVIMSEINQYL